MKPFSKPTFTVIITLLALAFLATVTWWLLFVISSFRDIGTPPVGRDEFEINLTDYNAILHSRGQR